MIKDAHDLGLIIDSKIPLIRLESHEESRALELLTRVAIKKNLGLQGWSVTEGLHQIGFGELFKSEEQVMAPKEVLQSIKRNRSPGLFVLCDFHPYLEKSFAEQALNIRLLKDIALNYANVPHTLILLSHAIELPSELHRFSAYFRLSLPSEQQLVAIVREEAKCWSEKNPGKKVRTDNAVLRKLLSNLAGLSASDARRLVRGVIFDDGAITEEDLPELNKAKFQLMDMEGVLSFEYDTERFADVGGLKTLKHWLEQRREAFLSPKTGSTLARPKGMLLLGVQGGGKSLSAKAVAGLWGVPLLRLDFGALYNKYIGETEKNLRDALQLADLMAPCVLWVDEIEKGINTESNDEGVSQRILATLLTWLAERKAAVFVVATANDISRLPAELLRKGRLDEIFFVDLPDEDVREDIFRIHLGKRGLSFENFDLGLLAKTAEGFSGAEIEQAVVAALYRAAAQKQALGESHVLEELSNTYPLSVTMAEQLTALRRWASERAVRV